MEKPNELQLSSFSDRQKETSYIDFNLREHLCFTRDIYRVLLDLFCQLPQLLNRER